MSRDRLALILLAAASCGLALVAGCSDPGGGRDRPVFDDSVAHDKCALLSLADVAAATGVPVEAWQQRVVSGCLYTWPEGSLWLGSVSVHESIERAEESFARYTADAAGRDFRQHDEWPAGSSGRGLDGPGAAPGREGVTAMPGDAIGYRRLPGVGSEAALDNRGSMRVRYGNVVVWLTGKTGDRDWIDPEVAADLGRRMVANMDAH